VVRPLLNTATISASPCGLFGNIAHIAISAPSWLQMVNVEVRCLSVVCSWRRALVYRGINSVYAIPVLAVSLGVPFIAHHSIAAWILGIA
jgi:hypothetical protein